MKTLRWPACARPRSRRSGNGPCPTRSSPSGPHRTNHSSSDAVLHARTALATRPGELMRDAGMKDGELSARCGWHAAKTSRILNAKAAPTNADIRAWCRACGADDQADELIASNRAADSLYVEWRRLTRTGLRHAQTDPSGAGRGAGRTDIPLQRHPLVGEELPTDRVDR
ncbi:helix-turn-helix transcriptional regulator [Kitasatospora purpeofusca]|uniref:helix-turn-helix domain-containing protein n=1 Tax=Kitasatospora purpeofusca TaxID=67352 RepID=UPI0030F31614